MTLPDPSCTTRAADADDQHDDDDDDEKKNDDDDSPSSSSPSPMEQQQQQPQPQQGGRGAAPGCVVVTAPLQQQQRRRPPTRRQAKAATTLVRSSSASTPSSSLSSSSTTAGTPSKKQSSCGRFHGTFLVRTLFVASFLAAAVTCSVVAFIFIRDLEMEIGIQTYESVASTALEAAQGITLDKFKGGLVMESILSNAFPSADTWPMIGLRGFHEIAGTVASISGGTSVGLIVLVQREQVLEFEAHAKELYREQGYPESAGTTDAGFGIRRMNSTSGSGAGGYVLDRTGEYSTYGSRNKILAPVLDHSTWNSKMLMYNTHVSSSAVDSIIECSKLSATTSTNTSHDDDDDHIATNNDMVDGGPPHHHHPNCTVVTGFKMTDAGDLVSLLYRPIYPRRSPQALVGMLGISINFKDVLVSVVPEYFSGITAVLTTRKKQNAIADDHSTIGYDTVTYQIVHGIPTVVGQGDQHDPNYDEYGRSIVLNDFIDTDAADAVLYTLTLYPSAFDQFSTKSPMFVSLGFAFVTVFLALIFCLYDTLMRRQSDEQKLVLELKRKFVRFISHEIRTPLNTVCVGLELLESDLLRTRQQLPLQPPGTSTTTTTTTTTTPDGKTTPNLGEDTATAATTATTILLQDSCLHFWYDVIRDVQENAASAVEILNDLLNYDKIESGVLQLDLSTVPILDLISKTIRKFQVQAANKSIHLSMTIVQNQAVAAAAAAGEENDNDDDPKTVHDDDMIVFGDEMRLGQVLCNLISNALKFTPVAGTIEIRIEPVGVQNSSHQPYPLQEPCNSKWYNDRPPAVGGTTTSSSSSSTATVTVGDRPPRAGSILIQVKDTGAGMTKDQIAMIFKEGVQFDANKLQAGGGSGLGLCISKGIIDCHGGFIHADSDGPGSGSTFTVELPLHCECLVKETTTAAAMTKLGKKENDELVESPAFKPQQPFGGQGAITEEESGTSSSLPCQNDDGSMHQGYHNILVVEDVASSRKMLMRLLERNGHTCVGACDGQEAVDAVFSRTNRDTTRTDEGHALVSSMERGDVTSPFDTILMDYEMPLLNGPDATEKLRQLGYQGSILGVTGNVLDEDVTYFLSKGADDVLPKPVSLSMLNDYWTRHRGCRPRIASIRQGGAAHQQQSIISPASSNSSRLDQKLSPEMIGSFVSEANAEGSTGGVTGAVAA